MEYMLRGVIEVGLDCGAAVVDLSMWCYIAPCKGKLHAWDCLVRVILFHKRNTMAVSIGNVEIFNAVLFIFWTQDAS